MIRVFLVRHGQTWLNAAGRVSGLMDPGLDAIGRQQAEALTSILPQGERFNIVASPLRRAWQTAQIVAKGSPVTVIPEFRDRDYGPWTGWPACEVSERFGRVDNAPGIEPAATFMRRVAQALERTVRTYPNRTLIVMGHAAVNRAVFGWFFPGWKGVLPRVPQHPGCWNCIDVDGEQWELLAVNSKPADMPVAGARQDGANDRGRPISFALDGVTPYAVAHHSRGRRASNANQPAACDSPIPTLYGGD